MDTKPNINVDEKTPVANELSPKLYKERWLTLILFTAACPCSSYQAYQYTVIADVVTDYYNVSYDAVNWTNLVILLISLIFVYPSCYIIDKYGIRVATLIATFGTCAASWMKVFSVSSNSFWVIILAQIVLAIGQVHFLSIPPKLAAYWFGANEVSAACSVAVTGVQIGAAFGFALPPLLIKKETAEDDFLVSSVGLAFICTIAFIAVFFGFTNKPPVPPSYAAMKQDPEIEYMQTIKRIVCNIPFLLILIAVAVHGAVLVTVETLLNQLILKFHPHNNIDVGTIGLLMIILGAVATVLIGIILDKFKVYRSSLLTLNLLVVASLLMFTYTIQFNIVFSYISCIAFSCFLEAYWTVCQQISIETLYPEPEAVIFGLTNASGQALGIGYTSLYSYIFNNVSDIWANHFLSVSSMVCFFVVLFSKFKLNRQVANIENDDKPIDKIVSK